MQLYWFNCAVCPHAHKSLDAYRRVGARKPGKKIGRNRNCYCWHNLARVSFQRRQKRVLLLVHWQMELTACIYDSRLLFYDRPMKIDARKMYAELTEKWKFRRSEFTQFYLLSQDITSSLHNISTKRYFA